MGSNFIINLFHYSHILDVPAWLRMLRLHKYNHIFETMKWQDMIKLSNDELEAKGVAALGARRKMLKVFETVRAHCDANVSFRSSLLSFDGPFYENYEIVIDY